MVEWPCHAQPLLIAANATECEAAGGRWTQLRYNFDNTINALLTLFVVSSKDGWVEVRGQFGVDLYLADIMRFSFKFIQESHAWDNLILRRRAIEDTVRISSFFWRSCLCLMYLSMIDLFKFRYLHVLPESR